MAEITLHGNPIHSNGTLPTPGDSVPDFQLTAADLSDKSLSDFPGKKILNIFPSVDTPVCAQSVRQFNEQAGRHANVAMLQISADLPFAQGRFCSAEGLEHVTSLSMLRDKSFATDYGVLITDGPLAGLCARAVVVLDSNNRVLHSELVSEIANEPNYEAALNALG